MRFTTYPTKANGRAVLPRTANQLNSFDRRQVRLANSSGRDGGQERGGRVPIFAITDGGLEAVTPTKFGNEGLYERRHIQALLRDNIEVLGERLLVLAEEFGDWLDSARRIDLLCLDQAANLVVVELKRTEDGGHMELQAVRYAAMVSNLTFDHAAETLARHATPSAPNVDRARETILEFLGWDEVDYERFGNDTRIVLAAADFAKELTTAVIWLNDRGIDIRCIRLKPYRLNNGPLLLDIQQLIPLPEASAFQTQIGVKRQAARQGRAERHELRHRWWSKLLGRPDVELHRHLSPTDQTWLGVASGIRGLSFVYVLNEERCFAELYIDSGKNANAYNELAASREEIEVRFGGPLIWDPMEDRKGCRIRVSLAGGYRSPECEWDELQARVANSMSRLSAALHPHIKELALGPR